MSETKLNETIFSSELEVDGYDLVRLDRQRRVGSVACYIKSSIGYSFRDVFVVISKVFLLTLFCLNLS